MFTVKKLHQPILLLAAACVVGAPTMAFAHHGSNGWGGLSAGLTHPLSGLDHLLALLATGLWAAQRGGRAQWAIPLTFIAFMAVGGGLGIIGVGLPFVEIGIATSVLLIGLMVAAAARLPLGFGMVIMGLFALCHGHAHGAEMPALASSFNYGVGMLLTSGLIAMSGVGVGHWLQSAGCATLLRWAGAAVAGCGMLMIVG